jgi:uncharacterized membrane protein YgaE (UPF0421/DUF939 family)
MMNVTNFVLFITLLTFVIGLGVATVIWGINWLFSPKDHTRQHHQEKELHQILTEYRKMQKQSNESTLAQEDLANKELYAYHHGKN